jgi:D-sedoheptulose 7-phosphate isomerase
MTNVSKSKEMIAAELLESAQLKEKIATSMTDQIAEVADVLAQILASGGKVLLVGNGGSAADAQHVAAELVGRLDKMERPGLAAIALSTNTSTLTAVGNDYGFEAVFARQVEALAGPQDVVLGLSTSGNSLNVVKAIEAAVGMGVKTIGLTGKDGGQLADIADLTIIIPSQSTPRIQEAHITIGHIVCRLVEEALFGQEIEG